MSFSRLCHMPLDVINTLAHEVAGHACSCAGATPQLPEHLSARFAAQSRARDTVRFDGCDQRSPT
jgi:hypothetical protein